MNLLEPLCHLKNSFGNVGAAAGSNEAQSLSQAFDHVIQYLGPSIILVMWVPSNPAVLWGICKPTST